MSIYVGNSEIKNIYIGTTAVKEVYVGTTKVRPTADTRTFTISWTEQSNMSSGWTYSDDAAGLTAGSGDFDDFFGYSAVLINTSGVETAEMKQSKGVFTGAMTTLGNITSGDNVMIKFPVRGIKMSKSGGVVTLSITGELNKAGYQYYAFCTGTLSNPGTPKDVFYLGAYEGYNNSNVLKSWSGKTPTASVSQSNFCTYAKANGSGYNIIGFYQREYINALYMMKYGNPNSQSVIGNGYVGGSSAQTTGATNSITNATGATSTGTTGKIKLFGLENRWGNLSEWLGGCYTNSSKVLYTMLSGWSGGISGGQSTGTTLNQGTYNCLSGIAGNNNAMFAPLGTTNSSYYNIYYCDRAQVIKSNIATSGGAYGYGEACGAFLLDINWGSSETSAKVGSRLMFL